MCVAPVGLDPRLHGRHRPRDKFVAPVASQWLQRVTLPGQW